MSIKLGTRTSDFLEGTARHDLIIGRGGDDTLIGNVGKDWLLGGVGNDGLEGGEGSDYLSGGRGNDSVDGGEGSDWVIAGGGDDLGIYRLSENPGARDHYNGGTGYDTLRLVFTEEEFASDAVQADIAGFREFLEDHGHWRLFGGSKFQFSAFDLTARGWEAAEIIAPISADPDAVEEGYDITDLFPGVMLSVEGEPDTVVIAANGIIADPGPGAPPGPRNFATTGTTHFGQDPAQSPTTFDGKPVWDEDNHGLLRVDFDNPTDFVGIDFAFDDDDIGALTAFDADGNLLERIVGAGDGRTENATFQATITRDVPDIAYVTAGGVDAEALYLDNLRYNLIETFDGQEIETHWIV